MKPEMNRLAMVPALAIGLAIAFLDSRPNFDDAGITAGLMLIFAGVLGWIAPQRPWLVALLIGIWIPVYAIVRHPEVKTLLMLVVLGFPLAGAYAGAMLGRDLRRT